MRNLFALVGRDDVVRGEVAVDINAEAPPFLLLDLLRDLGGRFGQIADVTVTGLDAVLVSEEPAQSLRLTPRHHEDQT
jgi:hypothetical protein